MFSTWIDIWKLIGLLDEHASLILARVVLAFLAVLLGKLIKDSEVTSL